MEATQQRLADIVGQVESVSRLTTFINFYRANGSTPGNILLLAEEGMGCRTIALAVVNELGVDFQQTEAATLKTKSDLTFIITGLCENQVLLVRDMHRIDRIHAEMLSEVLDTQRLTISIGKGPATREHVMDLKPFTLIATAPKKTTCPAELLNHFSLILPLQPYSTNDLETIAGKIALQEKIEIDLQSRRLIALHSGGRPRQLELLIRRVARAVKKQKITADDVVPAFAAFGIGIRTEVHDSGVKSIEEMQGVEFEKLVTKLLVRMEFRAEMTKATGDGGIDIVAISEKAIVGGKYLFQCKRYSPENLVGAATVRDFYGAVTADRAVKGVFITTSDFTVQAREFAERVGLELLNLEQLQNLLTMYGVDQLGS